MKETYVPTIPTLHKWDKGSKMMVLWFVCFCNLFDSYAKIQWKRECYCVEYELKAATSRGFISTKLKATTLRSFISTKLTAKVAPLLLFHLL